MYGVSTAVISLLKQHYSSAEILNFQDYLFFILALPV